jgi:predicted nucleic acid-binding protein
VRIILDSGAIIASERNDPTLAAILKAARKNRTPILVPATVVAETWRGPSTHARAAHLFGSVDGFPELNEQSARHVGALLAISNTAAIVDGNVVAIAIALRPATIVTSDVHDVTHLLKSAKIPHALFGARVSAAAQVIIIRI